jgi:hypothetical protein
LKTWKREKGRWKMEFLHGFKLYGSVFKCSDLWSLTSDLRIWVLTRETGRRGTLERGRVEVLCLGKNGKGKGGNGRWNRESTRRWQAIGNNQ